MHYPKFFLCLFLIVFFSWNCGYIHNPRVSKVYWENAVPDSPTSINCITLWPIHLVVLILCGVVDQTIHSVEIVYPAGVDSVDYFLLRGNGNNIMLERTIAVPKAASTPIIFVSSYIVRWFVPVSHSSRPFGAD